MKRILISAVALICALFSVVLAGAQQVPAPAGWSISSDGDKQIYQPAGLAATDSFTLTIDPPASLGDSDLQKWFLDRVKTDANKRGPFQETEPLQHSALGMLALERIYKKGTREFDVIYLGFPLADHRVLFCTNASNMRNAATYRDYVHAAGKICGQAAKVEDKPASTSK